MTIHQKLSIAFMAVFDLVLLVTGAWDWIATVLFAVASTALHVVIYKRQQQAQGKR